MKYIKSFNENFFSISGKSLSNNIKKGGKFLGNKITKIKKTVSDRNNVSINSENKSKLNKYKIKTETKDNIIYFKYKIDKEEKVIAKLFFNDEQLDNVNTYMTLDILENGSKKRFLNVNTAVKYLVDDYWAIGKEGRKYNSRLKFK